jgi:hypothetical protein
MHEVTARTENLQFANRTLEDVKMLRRIDEVAELMEALENLPEGNPLKDKPAYQAVAKRHYVRLPRIISITRPDQVLGFGGSDFSPETIQQRADEGSRRRCKQTIGRPMFPLPRRPLPAAQTPGPFRRICSASMVFCSAPTSVIICIRRNSIPAGLRMMISAASRRRGFDFRLRLDLASALFPQGLGLLRHGALHQWTMAIGIDLAFVSLEITMLYSADRARLDVARFAVPAIVGVRSRFPSTRRA